jgi:hypothetical protein
MAWHEIADQDTIDKAFGYQLYNQIVDNLNFLLGLYNTEHILEDGKHDPYAMELHWAQAFATYFNSTLESNLYNVISVNHVSDGTYQFNFKNPIEPNSVVTTDYVGSNKHRTEIKQLPQKSSVLVVVYNTSDNLVDLSGSEGVSIAVMRTP